VTSRIIGRSNPVGQLRVDYLMVALEMHPLRDELGSASSEGRFRPVDVPLS
jgi:hypothetical protein